MLFIYTTRVTSRMMRYKHWTPGEVQSAVGEDTSVSENPPTEKETRMRKPRTKPPTPLSKGKNHWEGQTVRELITLQTGRVSATSAAPALARTGVAWDRKSSPLRFPRHREELLGEEGQPPPVDIG